MEQEKTILGEPCWIANTTMCLSSRLAKDVFEILKSNFVGFYIIGSFVMGDWGKLPTKTKSNRALRDLVGKNLYENIKTFRKGKIEEFTIEKSYLNRIASYGLSKKKKSFPARMKG